MEIPDQVSIQMVYTNGDLPIAMFHLEVTVSKVFAEKIFTLPGVEAGCEEGEGRHRRAASWSPAQPLEGGGDQEGRHHPARPGQIIRL